MDCDMTFGRNIFSFLNKIRLWLNDFLFKEESKKIIFISFKRIFSRVVKLTNSNNRKELKKEFMTRKFFKKCLQFKC